MGGNIMKVIDIEEIPFHEIRYLSSGPKGLVRKCILPFYRAKVDEMPEGINSFMAASDMQGREKGGNGRLLGEQVAEELKLMQDMGDIAPIDLILLAGDLYDYPDCRKLGGTGDVTSVWNSFAEAFPMVIGVHGNHDMIDGELLSNAHVLDGNAVSVAGMKVSGVSGIIGKLSRNQRKSEADFMNHLSKSLTKNIDICLLHEGPDYPDWNCRGNPDIREWLEVDGQSLVIFGHCHWKEHLAEIGKNQALNVDAKVFLFSA